MSFLQAIVLALVQGVTEFLPISSEAHLVLVPWLLGWARQPLAFDIAVNTGTLAAVIVYFRADLLDLARSLLSGLKDSQIEVEGMPARRLLLALLIGTAPVAVAGLFLHGWVEGPLRTPTVIAWASIGFGVVLWWADLAGRRNLDLSALTLRDALWIGLVQALALVPGTSRAGITITAALALGYRRPAAARFSFLLYIPVGVLVAGKDGLDALTGELAAVSLPPMLVGFAVAAGSAYLVIRGLLAWLQSRSLTGFAIYRVLLGLAILGLVWSGGGSDARSRLVALEGSVRASSGRVTRPPGPVRPRAVAGGVRRAAGAGLRLPGLARVLGARRGVLRQPRARHVAHRRRLGAAAQR